jgi:hypothetical protein
MSEHQKITTRPAAETAVKRHRNLMLVQAYFVTQVCYFFAINFLENSH